MKARDLVYQQMAREFGVSAGYIPTYLKRFPIDAPIVTSVERMVAEAEIALRDAAAGINEIDIEDAAEEPEPLKALERMTAESAERRLRSAAAAHTSWANTADRTSRTRPGRDAFMARFERQVDPDGTLDPVDRARRAEHARKAYFLDLARRSAKARRLKVASR